MERAAVACTRLALAGSGQDIISGIMYCEDKGEMLAGLA